ncbi:MAG: hypothetical protein QOE84_3408 [Actinomycetota bacterium]|nr:hypothetical protein [Actinomycetota bacterium]
MQPDLPPGRYDPPRRKRPAVTAAVAIVAATAALVATYVAYEHYQRGRLQAELTRYVVVSDSVVRVTFDVVTGGHEGECKIRARDRDRAETGSELVPVHPDGRRSQVVTVDLPTRARAASAELIACRRV